MMTSITNKRAPEVNPTGARFSYLLTNPNG